MENKTDITVSQPTTTTLNMFANQDSFNAGYRMAQILSASTIVPKTFQGNIGNTMIAIDIAQRLHTNPLMIMQNVYIVYGMPSFSAKFLIACINASGLFATPLRYEFVGEEGKDTWGCYAYVIDKQGELLKGSTITIDVAKKKGWYQKDGEYTEITEENIDKLSEEEKLSQAQEKEKKEANTQPVDMQTNTSTSSVETKQAEQKTTQQKTQYKAVNKPQPMGKQDMPDMFKQP